MAKIPLIKPELVTAVRTDSASRSDASTSVLKAEVISSQKVSSETAKVVLKIGQHHIETLSPQMLNKGSQIEVKVLPGPELKIVSPKTEFTPQPIDNKAMPSQALQQLLLDRLPQTQHTQLPNLIKQLASLAAQAPQSSITTSTLTASNMTPSATRDNTINQKTSAQQPIDGKTTTGLFKTQLQPELHSQATASSSTNKLEQVKAWLQQLPQSQDISTANGLKNALNNSGVHAEHQIRELAQRNLSLLQNPVNSTQAQQEKPTTANRIFHQLQSLHSKIQHTESQSNITSVKNAPVNNPPLKLSEIVNKTAQALSTASHEVFSKLSKQTSERTTNSEVMGSRINQAGANTLTQSNQGQAQLTQPQLTQEQLKPNDPNQLKPALAWQNPLLGHQQYPSIESLLQDPLLQTPSSNNKLALNQLLGLQASQDQVPKIPLNWPEASNDGGLLKTMRTLLGHIEREQLQQLNDNQQINNPTTSSSQSPNQQWLPLIINHQQQLQLIEFIIDKEERADSEGKKKQHWFINLHFDLPNLGEMGIEISLFENECSTTFWSQNRSSLNSLSQHIQPLRQRLSDQGILVNELQSRFGRLEKRKRNIQQRLIDIST